MRCPKTFSTDNYSLHVNLGARDFETLRKSLQIGIPPFTAGKSTATPFLITWKSKTAKTFNTSHQLNFTSLSGWILAHSLDPSHQVVSNLSWETLPPPHSHNVWTWCLMSLMLCSSFTPSLFLPFFLFFSLFSSPFLCSPLLLQFNPTSMLPLRIM